MTPVFITGRTGYMGRQLIKQSVTKGYSITTLVRPENENQLHQAIKAIVAYPFDTSLAPPWQQKAKVLSLVIISQMPQTLVNAIIPAPQHLRLIEINKIRSTR